MLTDSFDYDLPQSSIAQTAIEPRHDARLLLASTLDEIRFREFASLMEPGDLLVVNRTRVRAARLVGRREPTGGRAEVLLTKRLGARRWEALLRPAKKLPVGSIVECGPISIQVVTEPDGGVATVTLTSDADIEDAINECGEVPLPPYFHGSLDSPDRYQTIFAQIIGSAAAPTAALHFTDDVLRDLKARRVDVADIELQVGLDTFRPMAGVDTADHVIHRERVVVDSKAVVAVNNTRDSGGRIVAVGTTVVRALESAGIGEGRIGVYSGETDLFIVPGYRFGVVDAMVTNFHAPRTTLIAMVAAAIGEKWRSVYAHAVDDGFRFLSFGDAMYIEGTR